MKLETVYEAGTVYVELLIVRNPNIGSGERKRALLIDESPEADARAVGIPGRITPQRTAIGDVDPRMAHHDRPELD